MSNKNNNSVTPKTSKFIKDSREIHDDIVADFMALPIGNELAEYFKEKGLDSFEKDKDGGFAIYPDFAACIYTYYKLEHDRITPQELVFITASVLGEEDSNEGDLK